MRQSLAVTAVVFASSTAFAQTVTLVDAEGFDWEILQDGAGTISDGGNSSLGLSNAYDSWMRLCVTTRVTETDACVTAERYQASADAMRITGDREFRMETRTVEDLEVYRRVYIPESGLGFARYVEVIHNPGPDEKTVKIRVGQTYAFGGDWGSNTATQLPATSAGTGTPLAAGQLWFTSDDGDLSGGTPSLGHVMDGPGGGATLDVRYNPFSSSSTSDEAYWEYGPVTLAAGETVAFLHFAVQQPNQRAAQERSAILSRAPAEALRGLGDLLFQIRNFSFGNPVDCGNGSIDTGEECDDSNTIATDACTDTCTNARCLDGITQESVEECDDGNGINDDGCSNDCRLPACGDGILQEGESCDSGAENSDTMPDACRTNCEEASCTDGVIDRGEMCDDGNDIDDDACSNSCRMATCGDGIVQGAFGEACDDGNRFARDGCTDTCEVARCGDGIVRVGSEECDDGNDVDDDACSNLCVASRCGDGVVSGEEECDEGEDNSNVTPDACRETCVPASCGDSVVDEGEACDDGNRSDEDACTTSCARATCGDGLVQEGELCDEGENNGAAVGSCNLGCDGFVRDNQRDAGMPDAGFDAGAVVDTGVAPDAADGATSGGPTGGSGCSAAGRSRSGVILLGFLTMMRRRRWT
ncbi:MAG: DUF4215 domain-containing protein [Myxococcota bacterium]